WNGIMPRALSIYLPNWPVYLAMRRHGRSYRSGRDSALPDADSHRGRRAPSRRPCVLLTTTAGGKQFVQDCCALAARRGVRRGLTLAHARAIVGRHPLIEMEYQPAEDEKTLHRLARWALRYAPTVAPDPPDGLLLDITGCARLFGG